MPTACIASSKHRRKCSMPLVGSEIPTSMPPCPSRASAIDIAPVFATDTTSTFAGGPNPKSMPYTRNLGEPATENRPTFAASFTRSTHASHLSCDPSPTSSWRASAIAMNAAKRPSVPGAASSSWRAAAMAGPRQLPRYLSGTRGFNRVR
ncbi:hypothetical protein VPH35_079581 [Triticum aestivum]